MKKIEYKAPEMEVVDLNIRTILCASPGADQGENGGNQPIIYD